MRIWAELTNGEMQKIADWLGVEYDAVIEIEKECIHSDTLLTSLAVKAGIMGDPAHINAIEAEPAS